MFRRLLCGMSATLFILSGTAALARDFSVTLAKNGRTIAGKAVTELAWPERAISVVGVQTARDRNAWLRGLSIELKNVTNKSVYYINATLAFPELLGPDGPIAVPLEFGDPEMAKLGTIAPTGATGVGPGETVKLKLPLDVAVHIARAAEYLGASVPSTVEFIPGIVAFGDGTQWNSGHFHDLERLKRLEAAEAAGAGKVAVNCPTYVSTMCGCGHSPCKNLECYQIFNQTIGDTKARNFTCSYSLPFCENSPVYCNRTCPWQKPVWCRSPNTE